MAIYMKYYLEGAVGNEAFECLGYRDTSSGALHGVIVRETFKVKVKEEKKEEEKEREKIDNEGDTSDDEERKNKNALMAIDALLEECENTFLAALREQEKDWQRKSKKIAYVAWIATAPSSRNKGVASTLITKMEESLLKHHFDLSVAFCVSPQAASVFRKGGYKCFARIPYASFEMKVESGEGSIKVKRPFAILPDEISIMVKKL
jgi:predicted acetyltransferase